MPTFPNVPNVPGVPALPRDPLAATAALELLVRDVVGFFLGDAAQQWGIFLDGVPVVQADSVVTFDYRQDWRVSDYPLEEGAFESYDKVQVPFDNRVRFAAGGSEQARQALLDSVASIAGTLELYDVVTPETVYQSVNVIHYDYRRSARNGVGLLSVDVWLVQVRVTTSAQFSSTKSPSGAGQVNIGTVQPTEPTGAQIDSLSEIQ